jgi:hypothetical protein
MPRKSEHAFEHAEDAEDVRRSRNPGTGDSKGLRRIGEQGSARIRE